MFVRPGRCGVTDDFVGAGLLFVGILEMDERVIITSTFSTGGRGAKSGKGRFKVRSR